MNNVLQNSLRALCLVPLTALCLVVAPAQAEDPPAPMPSATMPHGPMQPVAPAAPASPAEPAATAAPAADMPAKPMMSGMDGMMHMPMSGDPDKDFASMMKMHNQRAVDMAQMELANGKSPAMKAMATRMIAAHKKEIVQLEQWLAKQK